MAGTYIRVLTGGLSGSGGGGGGGGGANTALSNLTSPTAVNQDLIITNNRVIVGENPSDATVHLSNVGDADTNEPTAVMIRSLSPDGNAYTALYIGNDVSQVGLNIFLNGSGRSADGGTENATIRLENGQMLRLISDGGLSLSGTGFTSLDALGVANSAPATLPGVVINTFQVYDSNGNSLGFVALYDSVT